MTEKADVAVIGTGVMGRSLARNFARRGHTVALFDIAEGEPPKLPKNIARRVASFLLTNRRSWLSQCQPPGSNFAGAGRRSD